ncbi:hypothetical protein GXP67_30680 [Rhodocytophaga rosea]|uniref:Uncharacterized protein n=1 Tax=Rhodocytophaga rosea TaxID=2704465 RepID=A0A6C0GRH8_9BACT|nr:hypothetical protein [Rhodocytophaga rosea]QHT70705.1 hypothetical protein GXP67_30680 [Rhodocytophaga rosea]
METNNKTLPENYNQIKQDMVLHLLNTERSIEEGESNSIFGWLKSFMYHLSSNGWTRFHIYTLILDTIENTSKLDEDIITDLIEYETALTGFCAPECTIRLANDPDDINDLNNYVGSGIWKE